MKIPPKFIVVTTPPSFDENGASWIFELSCGFYRPIRCKVLPGGDWGPVRKLIYDNSLYTHWQIKMKYWTKKTRQEYSAEDFVAKYFDVLI